jgi:hypothetical protein
MQAQNNNYWLKIDNRGGGQVLITVAGKTMPLRYTVHQQERLIELFKGRPEQLKAAEDANTPILKYLSDIDMDICEIALNPDPETVSFTREELVKAIDIDQARMLAEFWQREKVGNIVEKSAPPTGN